MSNAVIFSNGFAFTLKPEPPVKLPTPVAMGSGFILSTQVAERNGWITKRPSQLAVAYNAFWETFKNSVIVRPFEFDLGVSADATTRQFDFWHTFVTPLAITDILQTGTRGIILTREGGGTKDIIAPLGLVKYKLDIGLQTDTLIDAKYEWKTNPFVPMVKVTITGSRIVPWPYIPEGGYTETREWLTDVIRTRNKEQRLSLRQGPRKTVSYSYLLSNNDLANMWSHSAVWVNKLYAVPQWDKFLRVGAISKDAMELPIDGISLGLIASGFAFIYENNFTFEVRPLKSVSNDKIEFVDAVTRDYKDATVLPVDLQKHEQPLNVSRTAFGVSKARAVWEKLDDTGLASNPFPLYLNRPVMLDHILMNGASHSERFGYEMDRVDSETGLYTDFQEYNWLSQSRFDLRWSCDTVDEYDRIKGFLDYCRGKQGEFFVPTWNTDLTLAQDIVQSDSALQVKPCDVTLFFKPFHVMIQYLDGSHSFASVTSASRGSDFDTLKITPALPDKDANLVVQICRLNLMRFDTDRFEFQHRDSGVVDISAPVVAVPE
ncbi:tail assembly protein [Vibrio phage vB_VnaS-AQKL99]|nr:tail assembly protein [Vibrio phage vB_VnaS-AQKL99]